MSDQHLGKLTYIRVYSGTLDAGTQVLNSTKDRKERIGKIYQMHANKRRTSARSRPATSCAVIGLKNTTTGDTLCDTDKPVILESMNFPAPVISVAIEPKTKADQEKLGTAIQRLAEEDPTFQVRTDEETGQTIIAGMGELHLEVLVDRMRREFKRRGQRRQAAGRLPRDDPQASSRRSTTPTRSRPVGPASSPRSDPTSSPWSTARRPAGTSS